ncbi:MAG: leucine-rich repeat domain-containing protein [Coriobacteriales bacterium]|jgi:hypothetical protein|nr:leucine-rich repeat domain-containing protein [Coriobacteriales bacterium]
MKLSIRPKASIFSVAKTLSAVIFCVALASSIVGCQKNEAALETDRPSGTYSDDPTATSPSADTENLSDSKPTDDSLSGPTLVASPEKDFSFIDNEDNTVTITEYKGAGGTVVIPSKLGGKPVTSIGAWSFAGCSTIASITIPNSVTAIETGALDGCTGLVSIIIPSSVTIIGAGALGGCTSLTSIIIPDSVTAIDGDVFWGCTCLTTIVIPASVTMFSGSRTFENCSSLESIYFEGNAPDVYGVNHFMGTAPGFTIYYRRGTTGWGETDAEGNPLGTWQGYPLAVY